MKKKFVFAVIIGSIGMAGAIIAAISYVQHMLNPPRFAPVTWDSVTPADIQSVTISPLLSYNSIQGLTVNRSIPITDRKTIISMWQEMRGKNDRSGHWTFIEGLKVTYQLDSGKIIAFCITLNSDHKAADYYYLENPEDYFYIPNFAGKGSAELYQILVHQIESNGLKWVRDNPDYWKLGTVPEYKGENIRS